MMFGSVKFTVIHQVHRSRKSSILGSSDLPHIEKIMDDLNLLWTQSSFGSIWSSI